MYPNNESYQNSTEEWVWDWMNTKYDPLDEYNSKATTSLCYRRIQKRYTIYPHLHGICNRRTRDNNGDCAFEGTADWKSSDGGVWGAGRKNLGFRLLVPIGEQ